MPRPVADVLHGRHHGAAELHLRPEAELVHGRRVLVRILDAPLHPRDVDSVGRERREPRAEREGGRVVRRVRLDGGIDELRQVQPELALGAVAIHLLIEDAVPAAQHHAGPHGPGEPDARRHVVAVGPDERPIEDAARPASGEDGAGGGIDVGQLVLAVEEGREVLVAHAVVEREPAPGAP